MKARNFELASYFQRIDYDGPGNADIDTVTKIMRRQLFSVPFENLDVQAGKIVSLVPEDIVAKILGQARGGYCYEVNGLFAMALEAMAIPYRFIAARPMFYPTRRPRTHMAIIAEIEGSQWLCDLGFGSYGIRAPINIDRPNVDHVQDLDTFRLNKDDKGEYVLSALIQGDWVDQYGFNLSHQEWIDFAPANYLNSSHPDAIFVQKLLVVLHDPEGRNILVGDTLKTIKAGSVDKEQISPGDIAKTLTEVFRLPAFTF